MKHTFRLLALVALFLAPCGKNYAEMNPSKYITDPQKRAMITSLEELDPGRLYLMNYTYDYRLDDVLDANIRTVDSAFLVLQQLLFDEQPQYTKPMDFSAGCSAFAITLKDSAQFLMGRNYDYCHKEGGKEVGTAAVVLFTAPEGGKKSINFVDAYWMGFRAGFYTDGTTDISNLMFLPYSFCDGMNEDGLAISVLHLDGSPAEQNEAGKPDIYTSVAMRAVLDRCGTVDSAIAFFESYNMHMATPAKGSLHFMLADSLGKYAVVEWSFEDPMNVDSTTVPTYFTALQSDSDRYVTNFYTDPRLKYCIFGGLSQHGRARYDTLRNALRAYDFTLTQEQTESLLQSVSQDANPDIPTSHTQWSNVYNLSRRTVRCAILQEYEHWFEFTVTGKIIEPTDLNAVEVDHSADATTKYLLDGQLYIRHQGVTYDAKGARVK